MAERKVIKGEDKCIQYLQYTAKRNNWNHETLREHLDRFHRKGHTKIVITIEDDGQKSFYSK